MKRNIAVCVGLVLALMTAFGAVGCGERNADEKSEPPTSIEGIWSVNLDSSVFSSEYFDFLAEGNVKVTLAIQKPTIGKGRDYDGFCIFEATNGSYSEYLELIATEDPNVYNGCSIRYRNEGYICPVEELLGVDASGSQSQLILDFNKEILLKYEDGKASIGIPHGLSEDYEPIDFEYYAMQGEAFGASAILNGTWTGEYESMVFRDGELTFDRQAETDAEIDEDNGLTIVFGKYIVYLWVMRLGQNYEWGGSLVCEWFEYKNNVLTFYPGAGEAPETLKKVA